MQMMSLVKGGESTSLGLTMLLTASEELATPREDIATTRSILLSGRSRLKKDLFEAQMMKKAGTEGNYLIA